MSLENKLTYLNGTKDAIKQAIIGKGVSVTEADTFRSYATKIGEIQGGGSGGDCPKYTLDLSDGFLVNFFGWPRVTYSIKDIILPEDFSNIRVMSSCFADLYNITRINLPSSLPNVTTMSYCFQQCNSLKTITLLDLPKLKDMYSCFQSCSSLTSITLPSSLPNVTTMDYCFQQCKSLTSITLPNLPSVTTMSSCFIDCYGITKINLPSSLPKVEDMYACFSNCRTLSSITLPDLPNVTSMNYCFNRCTSLQNLTIGNINPNITTLTNWYISTCTKLTVDSLVNIMNALPTITSTKTCTIGTTNLSKLSAEQLAIGTSKGWTIN